MLSIMLRFLALELRLGLQTAQRPILVIELVQFVPIIKMLVSCALVVRRIYRVLSCLYNIIWVYMCGYRT